MNNHSSPHSHGGRSGNRTLYWLVFCGFLLIAEFFLLKEHRAHVYGALPFLLLLACPLMHIFMHGGHGRTGHRGDNHGQPRKLPAGDDKNA